MTPQKRNSALPKYVTQHHSGAYMYRPYQGKNPLTNQSVYAPAIMVAPEGTPLSVIHRRVEELQDKTLQFERDLDWLRKEYLKSKKLKALALATQTQYTNALELLCRQTLANGKPFGSIPLKRIDKVLIQNFIEHYASDVAANRYIACLATAWRWAEANHRNIPTNPAKGIYKNKEQPRTRNISNAEYLKLWSHAPAYLKVAMELAYCCRARISEIAALRWDTHIYEDGLLVERLKGSKSEITAWSPRLKTALSMAEDLPLHKTARKSPYIVHIPKGTSIKTAYGSAWKRLCKAQSIDNAHFHDLKAKGVTDQETPYAGHKSPSQLEVYIRRGRPDVITGSQVEMSL